MRSNKADSGRSGKLVSAGLGIAAIAATAWALRDFPAALGGQPNPHEMKRSPRYRDGAFHNVAPTQVMPPGSARETLRELVFGDQTRHPRGPIPLVSTPADPAADGLHITWYGHASSLVEIDGKRVLIDPVWSDRCSPVSFAGPRRLHPCPIELDQLPALDAVVISHDHYDHLDMATVRKLVRHQTAPFLVPLGVATHLRRWKVPESRIIELDWDEYADIAGLRLTATAAQHFSGRLFSRNNTLWASWVIAGPTHRVFYTGDSGYFPGYAAIGAEHGPFDATLVQIGAYGPGWPDIHMTPEQGIAAHIDVRGQLLIPVHWGTFNLAIHSWAEPANRIWREAKAHDVSLALPRPGERINVAEPAQIDAWWQALS